MGDEIDPDQHLRVVKALEQVNGLQYRYYASQKEAKSVLKFDSDDSDDDSGHHRHTKRLSRSSKANEDHKDDQNEDEDDEQSLSFDDHIDRILRKTRTIALLKIANNTAEILPDDPLDCCEGEDFFYDEDEDGEDDGDSYETQDTFVDSTSLRQERSFLRRGNSMRSAPMSDGDAIERDESVVAAMRLVRTLSSFLSLPRVISYKDLEMITESLLDEQPSAGHHEDYGDLIDFHVDSARESSSAAEDDSHGDGEAAPLWKRRNTKTIEPLALPDDPDDLELHQRRMFMEANRFSRFSSKNFLIASNRSLMSAKASMRQLGHSSPTSFGSVGSFRNGGSVAEENDEGACDEASGLTNGDEHSGESDPATAFDEEQYIQWHTEVKAEYLAWINAKVEAKKRRRETLKKEAGKKPRWLLLYEARKQPEQKEPRK